MSQFRLCVLWTTAIVALAGCAQMPEPGTAPIRRPQVASVEVPGPLAGPSKGACASNEFLKDEVPRVSSEVVKTDRMHRFFDPEPARIARGLDALRVEGSRLSIVLSAKGQFDEFAGPISETIESSQYEASPGVALIAHTITLGIGLLVAPIKSAQHAFGCVDRRVIRREVRAEDSVPTGASQWRDVPANFLLRVEGAGPPRDLSVRHSPQDKTGHSIDLLDAIVAHRNDGLTAIRVRCLNCAASVDREGGDLQSPPVELSIRADFGPARAAEIERRERLAQAARIEQQARAREAQLLGQARTGLVGRWDSREACVNAERQDFGLFFEAGPSGSLRSRRVLIEGNRPVTKLVAESVRLRVVDAEGGVLEADLPQVVPGSRRSLPQRFQFRLRAEQMQIVSLSEDGTERIRAGLSVRDGRPVEPLFNCFHPEMVAARGEADRVRAEQLRAAEAIRQQQAREEAERRRVEEALRLEREREAAAERRIQEERRRRQEI
jgi:hypothetical protein